MKTESERRADLEAMTKDELEHSALLAYGAYANTHVGFRSADEKAETIRLIIAAENTKGQISN
jgi:hypothetical protein